MMDSRAFCKSLIESLIQRGADKVQINLNQSEKTEYNLVYKELNLLRSMDSASLYIMLIKDQRQVTESLNQLDDESLKAVIDNLFNALESAKPDPAFDIAEYQKPQSFLDGPLESDQDLMIQRLQEYAQELKTQYPSVYFDATLSHTHSQTVIMNSNGVEVLLERGFYYFMSMFTAKKDGKMSSMNYVSYEIPDLQKSILDYNQNRELIRQIEEQTEPKNIPAKFKGDVIVAPTILADLTSTLLQSHFSGYALLEKISRFPNHLEQKIFSDKLTVANRPRDPRLAMKYFVNPDGYVSREAPIIEAGVLKHYLMTIYTANKTGKKLSHVSSDNLIIEGGNHSLQEMIQNTTEGILCMRASYGSPGPLGDMSTVAKNSYYIKDGKVRYPVHETMISFNLIDAFLNIDCFSRETHLLGSTVMPYLKFGEAVISKKD
ncbi:MAG: PmbA protein [Candidatus Cloacimonadota bacterium]|nr:PmbA protein [Candidatus Cloacimonadota bacterium]